MKLLSTFSISCLALASAVDVVWYNPPSGWSACGKLTNVFGVEVCVTPSAWSQNRAKCDHVVNVFYQLLDNNADGIPDDTTVLAEMVNNNYLLYVPNTEQESEQNDGGWPDSVGESQMTGIFEAVPNSCDAPTNRGASAFDRSTWVGARFTNNASCDNESDATTEEILHLITVAAGKVYPSKWAPRWTSQAGAALQAANGNCGWGYQGNWKDPSSNECSGQYAYNDRTCDENCLVVEGIYWASISYIGGLYTRKRTSDIQIEWLMATPDTSMVVEPSGVDNAISLQSGSPALYALVSDTTSPGHAWLPSIMPDGNYQGFGGPSPTAPPMNTPTNPPNSQPTNTPVTSPTNQPVPTPTSNDDGSCGGDSPCENGDFCNFDDGYVNGGFCESCPSEPCNDIGLITNAGVQNCQERCEDSPPTRAPTSQPTSAPVTPPTNQPVPTPTSNDDGSCGADSPCENGDFCNFDDGYANGGFCESCPSEPCTDIGLITNAGVQDCQEQCGSDDGDDPCEDDPDFAWRNDVWKDCDWVANRRHRRCYRHWEGEPVYVYCPVSCRVC